MEKSAGYLAKKLPFANILLKNLACLSPLLRSQPGSLQMITAVVDNLPYCNYAATKDNILPEWRKYQEEVIPEEFYIQERGQRADGTAFVKYKRVDDYWHRILQLTDARGDPKYPTLAFVIKMALSLSHGQADVERGFSVNKQILSDRTLLSQKALSATRTVKEVITRYGSVTNVQITPSLIASYRSASKLYKEALEMEKAEKTRESLTDKRKQPFDDERSAIQAKKKEFELKQEQAEKLISEGTERLTQALKSNKMDEVLPSQALLESGNQLLKECRTEIGLLNKQLEAGQHQATATKVPRTSKD